MTPGDLDEDGEALRRAEKRSEAGAAGGLSRRPRSVLRAEEGRPKRSAAQRAAGGPPRRSAQRRAAALRLRGGGRGDQGGAAGGVGESAPEKLESRRALAWLLWA